MVCTFKSIEETDRRRDTGLFVVERSDPSVDEGRRGRLPEVVADGAQHHRQQARPLEVVIQLARTVDHHQRMDPHVAFGMPFGLLLAADERDHLGQYLFEKAEVTGESESD